MSRTICVGRQVTLDSHASQAPGSEAEAHARGDHGDQDAGDLEGDARAR